jgi:hypothetical protein
MKTRKSCESPHGGKRTTIKQKYHDKPNLIALKECKFLLDSYKRNTYISMQNQGLKIKQG